MSRKHVPAHARQRQQLAELAARLMRERGLSLTGARDKAAVLLGTDARPGNPALPAESEIQQALQVQLALFSPQQRPCLLDEKRRGALEAMDFLRAFHPRLAGSVLDGTAQPADPVILHLHPDSPEEVPIFLEDQRLPARLRSAQVLMADGQLNVPCWHLVVDDTDFQLWVLPAAALQQAPLQSRGNPVAMERASAARLRSLIQHPDR